jgi:hypothetical protein
MTKAAFCGLYLHASLLTEKNERKTLLYSIDME